MTNARVNIDSFFQLFFYASRFICMFDKFDILKFNKK